jgi:hypothetical protein
VEYDMMDTTRPNIVVRGVAYARGVSSFDVEVTLWNDTSEAVTGQFKALAARLQVPRNPIPPEDSQTEFVEYLSLSVSPATTNLSIGAHSTQTFTLTFSGLPSYVALGDVQIQYDLPLSDGLMQYENGTRGGYATWPKVYIVASTPTGVQQQPWTDFLNYTCRWGFGATDTGDLKEKLTFGMHYSNRSPSRRLQYSPNFDSKYMYADSTDAFVDLKKFTLDMDGASGGWVQMQCADFAVILAAAFHSHGSSHDVTQLTAKDATTGNPIGKFWTTKLCRAGDDSTVSAHYDFWDFGFHMVSSQSDDMYDSSSSYMKKLTGASHMNPVPGWPDPYYWQTMDGTTAYGLARNIFVSLATKPTDSDPADPMNRFRHTRPLTDLVHYPD